MPEIGRMSLHHETHEDEGADEVSLAGLTLPAHGPTHEKDGADEIDATGLKGITIPNLKYLTYVGDDTEIRAITGVGFQPSMVFIFYQALIEAVKAPTGYTAVWDPEIPSWRGAWDFEKILSLDSDGFTIAAGRNIFDYKYNVICVR